MRQENERGDQSEGVQYSAGGEFFSPKSSDRVII